MQTTLGTPGMITMVQEGPTPETRLESLLSALESEMPILQRQAGNLFAFAHAWAVRHDAILDATPAVLLGMVQARLRRIGIRWGMMSGTRLTGQFPALPQDPDD